MTATPDATQPYEPFTNAMQAAAGRALTKADEQAINYGRRARWIPEDGVWLVASSREGEPPVTVRRKKDAAEVAAASESGEVERRGAKKGYWWFVLDCNCPAALSGYAVCWHKAAVFRWWQQHRRVDGKAYPGREQFSPAQANANAVVDPDGVEPVKDRYKEPAAKAAATGEPTRGKDTAGGPVYYDYDTNLRRWVPVTPADLATDRAEFLADAALDLDPDHYPDDEPNPLGYPRWADQEPRR